MRTKASNHNRFMRFITIPIRALGKARDFYVRSITDCAERVSYGSAMGIQSGPIHSLPKSFSVSSSSRSSSADSDDLRELIRVASTRRLGVDMDMDMQRRQMRRSTAAGVVPRSCSVGMGRIDEERPCEFGDNNYNSVNVRKELLVYPRSRSYAVTKTSAVAF
ncbi:hypothetical protein HYC85_008349 [Camellia sinensis]|uniref:Uncharacterized protein n=1 Tax=Camellia sinensis TaxID=4442 RepID=A0A7J7HRK8_CAMSI|nr:hypothetical protein HYC85_008349 [Camellia sinensis]